MTESKSYGKKLWSFAGGHIPLNSIGMEPDFSSHDRISILNVGAHEANVTIAVYYADQNPVGEFKVRVNAQRVRKIRFNDLIDPLPLPLDTPFGFTVHSDVDIVVQFMRMNTGAPTIATLCTTPYPVTSP